MGGYADGLWRLDLAGGRAERVARGAERLSDERITTLARGPAGSLWVGTRFGLNRFDPASGRVERFLPDAARADSLANGFIGSLHTDAAGRLWVGTYGGGISVLDAGGKRFFRMGRAQGLPDDNINAFVEDGSGGLWVSTDDGLALIDPGRFEARALRAVEGAVLPTYWTNAAARTAAGELLFGGAGGMTIVRPGRLQPWRWQPPVVATELQVGGRRQPLPEGGAAIVVPPEANALAVEFSAADYSAPERNRYAYRLEGWDRDWVSTDATRRLAVYANLPPGDYRLLLRGSNRDGTWGEAPLALPVQVLPAWYQTLWARAAAGVLALLALSAVIGWRTRALRLRQAELERKVRERTAELEAVSKALEEKSRVLELTSITDPLTQLHNRRYLTQHIDVQVSASLRRAAESPRAAGAAIDTDNVFFLVDVDRFKQVNDVHGHASGDAVLVQMGQRLRAMLRETDHLVRWGGEEFLVVARDTDRARAEELAERMRQAVAAAPFLGDDGRLLPVTCSIGFACLPFDRAQPRAFGWQDVVKLADVALYAAKRSGRDAWVGLHAADGAAGAGADTLASPAQALRQGQLRFTSNRAAPQVMAGLFGDDRGPAPAPHPDPAPVD
ncbi:MAG: diguanylate cyclase [Rubrivivax sp.]